MMENLLDKEIVTSNSYLLHHHELYKTVYISPDMTKYQRNKQKQLVEELKRRRANEPNLVIRDGVIVTRPPHQSRTANQMDTVASTPTVAPATNS